MRNYRPQIIPFKRSISLYFGPQPADTIIMEARKTATGMEANVLTISRYNAIFSSSEYVAADGHGYTLHLDKAATFPTLDAAAWTQRLHFPGHVVAGEVGY